MEFSLSASKLSAFKNLPVAPIAAKRPVTDTRHGITRSDDYAWLRADNWQEVFKDPSVLDPAIRAHLEAENAYQDAAMADTEELQKVAVRGNEAAASRRTTAPCPLPTAPGLYGVALQETGGQQPRFADAARQARDEHRSSSSTATRRPRARPISASPARSFARSFQALWGYDDKGSEFFTLKRPRSRDARRGPGADDIAEHQRRRRLGCGDCEGVLLRQG
jgi:oligopeptidase B